MTKNASVDRPTGCRRWLAAVTLVIATAAAAADGDDSPVAFVTQDIRNQVLDVADYRGQWVIVNFWATWCKPCRHEMPDLDALHRERDDVQVIGLAFEEVEPAAILAFLEEYPASYPIALVDIYEPPDVFGTPRVLPTTVVLGPEGDNRRTFVGPVTRQQLETYIDEQEEAAE